MPLSLLLLPDRSQKINNFLFFYKYVQAFTETDEELQQFKHCQFHIVAVVDAVSVKFKIITVLNNHFSEIKIIIIVLIISVTSTVSVLTDDLINLSSVITAVQSKSIFISEIKKICNK